MSYTISAAREMCDKFRDCKEEKHFEREVCKLLRHTGAWVSPRLGGEGIPDRMVCYEGLFFGCEFKTNKGKHSNKQKEKQKAIQNSGGRYYLIRPNSVVEFIEDMIYYGKLNIQARPYQ